MRELRQIPLAELHPDPEQPRKSFDEKVVLALAENFKAIGLQVPLIVLAIDVAPNVPLTYLIVDGETRYRAAQVAGLTELPCIVLRHRPSPKELLELRLGIDINHSHLKPLERAKALSYLSQLPGITLVEACKRLGVSQGFGTKLVAMTRLAPQLQEKVNSGWDIERAYVISQEPDHQKQLALAAEAGLSREQLRKKVRTGGASVALKTARFHLAKGRALTIQGPKMALGDAIEVLMETLKQLRKCQSEGIDLVTALSVFRDKSKSSQ